MQRFKGEAIRASRKHGTSSATRASNTQIHSRRDAPKLIFLEAQCAQDVPKILGKLPANFSADFNGDFFFFFRKIVGPVFPGFQAPPSPKEKFTPEITPNHVGIPIQFHFLEPKMFSRRFSAYGGGGGPRFLLEQKANERDSDEVREV